MRVGLGSGAVDASTCFSYGAEEAGNTSQNSAEHFVAWRGAAETAGLRVHSPGLPPDLIIWMKAIEHKLDAALATRPSSPPKARSGPRRSLTEILFRHGGSTQGDNETTAPRYATSTAPLVFAPAPSPPTPELHAATWAVAADGQRQIRGGTVEERTSPTYPAMLPGMLEEIEDSASPRAQEQSPPQPTVAASMPDAFPKGSADPCSGKLRMQTSISSVAKENSRNQLTWNPDDMDTSGTMVVAQRIGLQWLLCKFIRAREQSEANPGWGYDFVHSTSTQLFVSGIIVLHALLTGYSADVALSVQVWNRPPQSWVETAEILFSVFFLLELMARLATEKLAFFIGRHKTWNAFDSLIVALSVFDLATGNPDGKQLNSANVARILRLSRFSRLLRISRVMTQLRSLRLILYALLYSMSSLVWCFVFIVFIMYVFAVFVVYGVAEYYGAGMAATNDPETAAEMKDWWGGIYRAMITFFMAITGGADWSDPLRALKKIHPVYECLFIFYIFFMYFGVLNVVVGAFVATASQIAADDRDAIVRAETERLSRYTERIKGFFKEADLDHSGTLSWEEFRSHLADPKVKAYFQSLELDVSQAHILFELLDVDGSDQVTIDEFLDGCMRLKGQARSIDLNMLLFMCRTGFATILDMLQPQEAIAPGPATPGSS